MSALKADLAGASKGQRAAARHACSRCPAPDGALQRFAVYETSIMEPGLAAKHPEIKTYAGAGPRRSDRLGRRRHELARLPRLGALAPRARWYVDPYYKGDDSVYASYFTRDAVNDEAKDFVESDPVGEGKAADASAAAALGPEIQLRTYRLALTTDPSYATYFGGRQRHRGQGHADEPREPDLQHRVRDQAGPDRRHRQAEPEHGRAGDGRQRPVRLGPVLHGHATPATRCSTATAS